MLGFVYLIFAFLIAKFIVGPRRTGATSVYYTYTIDKPDFHFDNGLDFSVQPEGYLPGVIRATSTIYLAFCFIYVFGFCDFNLFICFKILN